MTRERWRAVVGYEGRYEVSNLGRVRSLQRVREVYGGRRWVQPERILAPTKQRYWVVSLCKDGKAKRGYVHRLVLEAFAKADPAKPFACHGPRGADCNELGNLYWGTAAQNNGPDKHRDGTALVGERHHKAVITDAVARQVKELLATGCTGTQAARRTGAPEHTVYQIKAGRQWKHVT